MIIIQTEVPNQSSSSTDIFRQSLNLSSVDFNNYLQSLQQRYLVTKIKSDKILFNLSPVFREYVKFFEKN